MSLTEQVILLSNTEFWGFVILALAISGGGFYFAFRNLRRARIIEDTPTARIRSAHQGYVELAGEAKMMEGEPILGPLTGTQCCWHRYKIERHGENNWHTIESGVSPHLFLLQDATGDCIIDPEGAIVTSERRSVWYGDYRTPKNFRAPPGKISSKPFWRRLENSTGRFRYTEERIHSRDPLYAIGLFKTLDEVDHIESRREMATGLLRRWKRNHQALLTQFDRNRDGRINEEEWEQVRQKAFSQAQVEHHEMLQNRILHTLSNTGSRRHPFLLSTLPQFHLVRRYRLLAGGSVAGFFLGGATTIWMLSIKLVT